MDHLILLSHSGTLVITMTTGRGEEVIPAYIQSATYDGVEDPHDDTCEVEEGHYEVIPE